VGKTGHFLRNQKEGRATPTSAGGLAAAAGTAAGGHHRGPRHPASRT